VRSLRHCTSFGVVKRIDESRSLKTLVRVDQVASTTRARLGQDTVCGCETFLTNSTKHRRGAKSNTRTADIWAYTSHVWTPPVRTEPGASLLKRT
jgi:hypothetical protein